MEIFNPKSNLKINSKTNLKKLMVSYSRPVKGNKIQITKNTLKVYQVNYKNRIDIMSLLIQRAKKIILQDQFNKKITA